LQEIWDTESGPEGVRRIGTPEVVSKNTIPHQACNTAEENTCCHQRRVVARCMVAHRYPVIWFRLTLSCDSLQIPSLLSNITISNRTFHPLLQDEVLSRNF